MIITIPVRISFFGGEIDMPARTGLGTSSIFPVGILTFSSNHGTNGVKEI